MKPVLIVCRAESYHKAPEWLSKSASEYDVLISQYGVDADEKHHACNGGKWIGICDLFNSNPELLEKYDYFWFPDDDIQTDPNNVVDFFKIAQWNGFQLSQPSLTPQSVYAYRLTISNPRFNFRLTNFVELMMPLVHKDLLHKLLPIMEGKHAALGVDWMWHKLVENPQKQVAIIDKVAMGHYRPRNTHLVSRMKEKSINVYRERDETVKSLRIEPYHQFAHEGELLAGSTVKGWRLKFHIVMGYFSIRHEVTQQRWGLKHYMSFLREN